MGLLAEKTHPYIKEKLEELLVKEGFSSWEARYIAIYIGLIIQVQPFKIRLYVNLPLIKINHIN